MRYSTREVVVVIVVVVDNDDAQVAVIAREQRSPVVYVFS